LAHTKNLSEGSAVDRPGLVHRIDKETSGLLVIAKNNVSHEKLARQFKDRTIERKYWCVVEGRLKATHGSAESYLARHPTHRKKFASIRDPKTKKPLTGKNTSGAGKWAKTHFKVLSSKNDLHYLELKLETGRTHQIRVHLSEMGCPIVGDELYGSKKKLSRFFLHAAELGFDHPTTGKRLFFKKDWPQEDKGLITSWGLLNAD
jgi:23S rRNA pseudouridine1911/1915/1917 synthase